MGRLKEVFAKFRRKAAVIASSSAVMALTSVAVFASGESSSGASDALSAVAITQEDLMPLFNAVSSNMGVILKVGIPLFGLFLVIGIVPKVIRHFTK